jgi:hypothetical protein
MKILMVFGGFCQGKQTQFYLAPRFIWGLKTNLKKQSQFVSGLIGVTSYLKGDYDRIPLRGAQENKAKQSQFRACPFGKLRASSEPVRLRSG